MVLKLLRELPLPKVWMETTASPQRDTHTRNQQAQKMIPGQRKAAEALTRPLLVAFLPQLRKQRMWAREHQPLIRLLSPLSRR